MGWPEYTYLSYVVIANAWVTLHVARTKRWRYLAFRYATVALCLVLLTIGGFWK